MKAGVKLLWLFVSAVFTAAGLGAPVIAEKLMTAKAINDAAGNAIGMIGIPLGLFAAVMFITLFFIE